MKEVIEFHLQIILLMCCVCVPAHVWWPDEYMIGIIRKALLILYLEIIF